MTQKSARAPVEDSEDVKRLIERLKAERRDAETLRLEETVVVPVKVNEKFLDVEFTVPGIDFLAPPEEPDELGRLGNYRVLSTGGMGVVFKAEDVRLRRIVELKTMKPTVSLDSDAPVRFLREAKATAAPEDDHIVPSTTWAKNAVCHSLLCNI